MKRDTKLDKLAAMLGIERPKPPTKDEVEQGVLNSREAEAVIAFGNRTQRFIQRECVQCGYTFAVNRSNISCCSDTCRQHYCLHKYGLSLDLNARTPEERWMMQTGGPEPLIVPPTVLPLILQAIQNRSPEQPEMIESQSLSLDELLSMNADVG